MNKDQTPRFRWVNFYLIFVILSAAELVSLIKSQGADHQAGTSIFAGVCMLLAMAVFWGGYGRYGIDFFAPQTRRIWPSKYTAFTLGLLGLATIPIIQLSTNQISSVGAIIPFAAFSILAIIAAGFDHRQLTKK